MKTRENHNFYYYIDKETINKTAINLIAFGGEIFKGSIIINNLLLIKNTLKRREKNLISQDELFHIVKPCLIENLTDTIRICIFFENYMKSVLISKGYLIHKIKNSNKYMCFLKKQKKQPILVEDFHNCENFVCNKEKDYVYNAGLLPETISIGTMLYNKDYTKLINLPKGILNTIIMLNKKRNQLHFVNECVFTISETFINEIEELNSFVEDTAKIMIRK